MTTLLAAILDAEPKPSLLHSAYGLWQVLVAFAVILMLVLIGTVVTRRVRRARGTVPSGKGPRAIPDAWTEAGRRAVPIRMDDPEPPTTGEPEGDEA